MPVLGKCLGCGFHHYQPFGSRCKVNRNLLTVNVDLDNESKMACIPESGYDRRDDPEYTEWLERQYRENLAHKQAEDNEGENKVLAKVLERLDKIEMSMRDGAGDMGAHRTQQSVPGRAVPTAAELTSLSDSIRHLSISVDAGKDVSTNKQGMEMRPEFHVQVKVRGQNISAMNPFTLKSEELLFGMLNVYLYLDEKGYDTRGYLKHFNFVAPHVMERQFTTLACIKYDRYIVDEVLRGGKFGDINPVAAGLFLHGGAVALREKPRGDSAVFTHFQYQPRSMSDGIRGQTDSRQSNASKLRGCNRENVPKSMPENWPSEVCFNYNVRNCMGKCLKLHVCSHCNLRHKLSDCKFASKEAGDRQFQPQYNQSRY